METLVPRGDFHISVEIIDFFRPTDNNKNVYITNIPAENTNEEEIYSSLYNKFSEFGLICDIRIFASCLSRIAGQNIALESNGKTSKAQESSVENKNQNGYYAFVNFYSHLSAAKAKDKLRGRLLFGSHHLKMKYATRKASADSRLPLYYTKCYELVNYYLGFNSWTTSVQSLQERKSENDSDNKLVVVCYECRVQLSLPKHGLHCSGLGSAVQYWDRTDIRSRSTSICRAKKQAYQFAVQDAFSKLLLVVTENGKVYPEIDTTIDRHLEAKELSEILPINVLDGQAESLCFTDEENSDDNNSGDIGADSVTEMDENNRRILAELVAGDEVDWE